MTAGRDRLRASLRRLRPAAAAPPPPLKADPTNAWEIAVAERLKAIQADIDELRSRLNWLLTAIVGAALANVLLAILK